MKLTLRVRHHVPPRVLLGTATMLAPILLPFVGYQRYVQLVSDLVLLNARITLR